MDTMISAAGATLLAATGIGCLYAAWRKSLSGARWPVALGWLLLLLSGGLWIRASGVEFGVNYALLTIPLFAWLTVGINLEVRQGRQRDQRAGQLIIPEGHTISRNVVLFVLAIPVAAVTSTFISIAAVQLLPWGSVDALVLAVLMAPVLWGIAMYWVCADPRPARPALCLILGGALCAALLYW